MLIIINSLSSSSFINHLIDKASRMFIACSEAVNFVKTFMSMLSFSEVTGWQCQRQPE